MDRGVLHKSAPLVGEMGEGHGWWSVNNLRPPFEHNPHLFLSSTASSSHSLSFSPLLLSNHYPLPATTTPWHDSNNSAQGQLPEEPWSQLLLLQSSSGGLDNGEERYNQAGSLMHERRIENWAGQASEGDGISKQDGYGGSCYIYNTSSQGSTGEEIQVPRPSPWSPHPHHTFQASSPRSSITSTTHGSAIMEFSNNSSSCERISTASGAALKKARIQDPSPAQPTVKVRKEKLGDRITALHQLVSPFGKTDTASVLLEAIGYIRFLHGQIEALSSPYLGRSSAGGSGGGCANSKQQQELQGEAMSVQGENNCIFPEDPGQLLHDNAVRKRVHPDQYGGEEAKKDLRSRGLCLVPVSCTLDVGSDAGAAGYWAPGFGIEFGR